MSLLDRLCYFGCAGGKSGECGEDLDAHNLRSLGVAAFGAAVLIVLFSFYAGSFARKRVFFLFALVQALVFIYSRMLAASKIRKTAAVFAGIIVFAAGLLGFALYIYIFEQGSHLVRFLLFLPAFETLFIFNFLFCLVFNAAVVFVFVSVCGVCPERLSGIAAEYNQYCGVLNLIAACAAALVINRYVSCVLVRSFARVRALENERNRYHEQSLHDQLTGMNNRRSFEKSLDFFTTICRNVHQTICIVMIDIDFFKNYNDFYGHNRGDDVLKAIGAVLKSMEEEYGLFAARVGGEEFIVIWTENRMIEAERTVLRLRQRITGLKIPHEASQIAPYLTASFGLYIMRGGSADSLPELYEAADSALYKAKAAGRDKIIILDSADRSYRELTLRHPDELPERLKEQGGGTC